MSSDRRKRGAVQRRWLDVLRWTIAVAALFATWGYGLWKGGSVMWLCLPIGVIVMVCTAAALTIPVVTSALVAVAFIYGIDSSLVTSIRNVAATIVLVGLAVAGWRYVAGLVGRERRQ